MIFPFSAPRLALITGASGSGVTSVSSRASLLFLVVAGDTEGERWMIWSEGESRLDWLGRLGGGGARVFLQLRGFLSPRSLSSEARALSVSVDSLIFSTPAS